MSNYVYYKATDEDGNTVLRHGWKKHKYLYIKNGKYVYPEDIYKTAKKAAYKITRSGQKLANDAKPYVSSVKKKLNSASKNANKAYKYAKKEYNRVSRDASKAYKSAKKKVSRSFNKAKRAGKAYLDYLTK